MKKTLPKWNKKFLTGVEEVDFQHQYFLKLIHRFHAYSQSGDTEEPILHRLVREIFKYAEFHFISEENLMLMHGYKGQKEHHELHMELADQLGSKITNFTGSRADSESIAAFMVEWFFNHTVNEDKKFADFLKRR